MSRDDEEDRGGEPIDAEFEPARSRPKAGVSGGSALLLAVIAAGTGAAGGAVAPRVPAVQSALDQVLPGKLDGAGAPGSEAIAAVDERLKVIERIMNTPLPGAAAGQAGDAGTGARVFALQAGLRDVENQLRQLPTSEQVTALVTEVRRLQEELPAVAAEARQAGIAARASYAVVAAGEASRASGPFEQAHAALAALLPDDPNVAALAPLARTGAPTRIELRDRFERLDNDIIRSAMESQAGAGFWGRIQAVLAQWIVVRRAGGGDTPDAIVTRAEAALASDQLDVAIRELNKLPAAPKRVAQPWIDDATRRLDIDTRLAAIRTELSRGS